MSGVAAVDLSQLPAPAVVEVISFEQIVEHFGNDLRARDTTFTALTESDPAYKVLQVAAYREMLLRQRVNDGAKAVMLPYAKGTDLDNLGAFYNVARLVLDPGDPSRGIPKIMESDEDYLRRIRLSPEGFSVAGPEGAYIFHALSASPDVLDASATSPSPGQVLVTVLSRTGDGTAPQATLDAVAAALSAVKVRPLTDEVIVQSAEIIPYQIRGTRYTLAGPDSAVVLANSDTTLAKFVVDTHKLGRDITRSGLDAAIHVPGMQRVDLDSPTDRIVISRTQASYCTAIDLRYGGNDE
jgi:phage-related baseplate assembly protein